MHCSRNFQRLQDIADQLHFVQADLERVTAVYHLWHHEGVRRIAGRVLQAQIWAGLFEPNPALRQMLDALLRPLDDGRARAEWGWQPRSALAMVDDFLQELKNHPERYT